MANFKLFFGNVKAKERLNDIKDSIAMNNAGKHNGSWLQHKNQLQMLKTVEVRAAVFYKVDEWKLTTTSLPLTGAIKEDKIVNDITIVQGLGFCSSEEAVLQGRSLVKKDNFIDDLMVVSAHFKEEATTNFEDILADGYKINGEEYRPIILSPAMLRQGKIVMVKKEKLSEWLDRVKEVNNGIGFFDKEKEISVGKATKLSTYGNLNSAAGRELTFSLANYSLVIFNNMSITDQDNMDGQSYHNHKEVCKLYGCPQNTPLYLQVRVSGCTKTGSMPVRDMNMFWRLVDKKTNVKTVASLSEIDKDDKDTEAWIVGDRNKPLLYVTDFNGFKAVPGEINEDKNVFKILQNIESTKASVSSQLIQYVEA